MWALVADLARGATGVTSLVIAPVDGLCPGEKVELAVTAIDERGKKSKVRFGPNDGVAVAWDFGPVTDKGELTMPLDARFTWGKVGTLEVSLDGDPAVHAQVAIPVRYDCVVELAVAGRIGDDGPRGHDGIPSPTRGTDGEDGMPGQDGKPGPELHVRTFLATEPRTGAPVLQVDVEELDTGTHHFRAVSPDEGQLVVISSGGDGGNGGMGGTGGAGGNGGGSEGRSGDGGTGGRGGPGGRVTVFVDATAEGHTKCIVVENGGGAGGLPGRGGVPAGSARPGTNGLRGPNGDPGPAPEAYRAVVGPLW